MKTIQEQYPGLYRRAQEIASSTINRINTEVLPDEGCPYPFQCLLETVIQELERTV